MPEYRHGRATSSTTVATRSANFQRSGDQPWTIAYVSHSHLSSTKRWTPITRDWTERTKIENGSYYHFPKFSNHTGYTPVDHLTKIDVGNTISTRHLVWHTDELDVGSLEAGAIKVE